MSNMISVLDQSDNEIEYDEVIWNSFSSDIGLQGVTGYKKLPKYLTRGRHFSWLHLFHS